jgi:hypothetical protein
VGEYTSIAIGTDNAPVISYFDYGSGHLKVAQCFFNDCSGGFASRGTADNSANVGEWTSIAIGTDGFPVISYYDYGNGHLKILHCTSHDCSTSNTPLVADSSSNVGTYTSIAIGSDGFPIVSYEDSGTSHIKVVHCTSLNCSTRDAPISVIGGDAYTSIAIGRDGFPIISYESSSVLVVLHCASVTCSSTDPLLVDNQGGVGYTSLAIGADGFPAVSYWDSTNGHLKVARARP